MKTSFALVLLILANAPVAQSVIDPGDNVIGAYFDLDADTDCIEGVDLNTPLPIYIILTRPTFSELYGFEFGIDYGSNLILMDRFFANSQSLNIGSGDNFIVGFGSPTATEDATLLVTLSMLHMGTTNSPSQFILSGSQPSSLDPDYPTVLLADDELLSTGLHSEYRPYTYLINGRCGFEDQEIAWDQVKSLYRR